VYKPGYFLLTFSMAASATLPVHAETPAEIRTFTQENLASCKTAGGAPKLLDGYMTATADLNGDGAPDYITDLAGLECANAWSYFCGSAGCPVTVWLSGPEGYEVGWGGSAQGWERRGAEIVVFLHGQLCDPPRTGALGCEVAMRFDETAKTPAGPAAPPGAPSANATGVWRLRQSGSSPVVAEAPGAGVLTALSALCLRDRPVMMAALSETAGARSIVFTFAFADRTIEVTGTAATATQKAYLLDPRTEGLAAALSSAGAVGLQIAGQDQGMLSLNGSTHALRAALSPCFTF